MYQVHKLLNMFGLSSQISPLDGMGFDWDRFFPEDYREQKLICEHKPHFIGKKAVLREISPHCMDAIPIHLYLA